MCHIFFIHLSVEGHLGCFQFLAIMNKAAMNIVEQVSLWDVGEFPEQNKSIIDKLAILRTFKVRLDYRSWR